MNFPGSSLFSSAKIPAALFLLALVVSAGPLSGQFNPPLLVTDGTGGHQSPKLVRGSSDIMLIALEKSGIILSTNSVAGFPIASEVVCSDQLQGGPVIVPGVFFNQHLVFHRVDADPAANDREIMVSQNPTGSFGEPQLVTDDPFDNHDPSGVLDGGGVINITWVRETSTGPTIFYRKGTEPEVEIDLGEKSVVLDLAGVLTVVYQTGLEIRSRAVIGGVPQPVQVLHSTSLPPEEWDAASSGEELGILLRDSVGLRFIWGEPGSLPPALTIDLLSGIADVTIDALPDGRAALFWTRAGIIHWEKTLDGTSVAGGMASSLPVDSVALSCALDSLGYMHLVALHEGEVFIANDVPTPIADFSIEPASGFAPLEILFTGLSEGVIDSLLWDFGDGTTGTYSEDTHLYEIPGSYDITLTVTGPGGTDSKTVSSAVTVIQPVNTVSLANIQVFAGQPVIHPLLASHDEPLQGFQVGFTYDSNYTPITEFGFTGTLVGSLDPEFVIVQIDNQGPGSSMVAVVIFDTVQPFDGRTLLPGVNQTLGNLIYTVPYPLPFLSSSPLIFTDNLGDPPLSNIFSTASGTSIYPYKIHGGVTISQQPQFLFIRGDANYDLSVNISDGIFLLSFLFSAGTSPSCPDSADANDDGQLNVADPVTVLQFLFNSGETIPYPYPGAGLDPTDDTLGSCVPSSP
ncbi:MAG TPA: PKD domain-containing protein [Planctomycetes bacterium]|nr:PKD domain-containing protein [Planctomycetota bacterium]